MNFIYRNGIFFLSFFSYWIEVEKIFQSPNNPQVKIWIITQFFFYGIHYGLHQEGKENGIKEKIENVGTYHRTKGAIQESWDERKYALGRRASTLSNLKTKKVAWGGRKWEWT